MSATDELRKMLDERGVEWGTGFGGDTLWTGRHGIEWRWDKQEGTLAMYSHAITPEQAIAATLGRPKVKARPYGYEPDTGAFDATRCECGCVNDISATYCNDCGGEIEIDMNAEKEIYHTPRHLVFAEKHDDGSLEFGGERYIAATLGSGTLTAEQVRKAIFDGSSYASYDGAKYYADGIGMQAIADELNSRAERTCRCTTNDNAWCFVCSECGKSFPRSQLHLAHNHGEINYCPNCGAKVIEEEE